MLAISEPDICRGLETYAYSHTFVIRPNGFSGRQGSALYLGTSQKTISTTSLTFTPDDCPAYFNSDRISLPLRILFRSINAVGVNIAPFSAHPSEEEVLLLPGLPLVNRAGENPAPGLWTFEVETPSASSSALRNDSPPTTIDYVHPGACACLLLIQKICFVCRVVIV